MFISEDWDKIEKAEQVHCLTSKSKWVGKPTGQSQYKGLEDMNVQAYVLSLDSKKQPEALAIPKVS